MFIRIFGHLYENDKNLLLHICSIFNIDKVQNARPSDERKGNKSIIRNFLKKVSFLIKFSNSWPFYFLMKQGSQIYLNMKQFGKGL